jgi:hypothetical protein
VKPADTHPPIWYRLVRIEWMRFGAHDKRMGPFDTGEPDLVPGEQDMSFLKSSRFDHISRRGAALVVAVLVAAVIYGLVVYRPATPGSVKGDAKGEDLRCYHSIVERVHAGEGYYEAAREELSSRGYATGSVFNWRLPLLAWLLGHLPGTGTGQALAATLALLTLAAWIGVFGKGPHSFGQLAIGSLAVLAPVIYSLLPGLFLAHEFWAGTLISLSLAFYGRGWRAPSVASGLTALFLRELALPFVLVMLVLSYVERHRREAMTWAIGVAAFGAVLLFHWSIVRGLSAGTGPLAQQRGWMALGGWAFVLSTARMHPYLFLAPPWVTAMVVPLVLLGLAGWPGPLGSRVAATVFVYVSVFLFVGLPYNQYWGLMYTGIMLLGLLYLPGSIRDLWQLMCGIRASHPGVVPLGRTPDA